MIPLAKDTRNAIGDFASAVENRSLLFEKMVLTKSWGHEARFDDANRFNVLRACSDGELLLAEDRNAATTRATKGGKNAGMAAYKAKVAEALSTVKVNNPDLVRKQIENSLNLLSLVEKAYPQRSKLFIAKLGGRLLINMAGGVQENAGMALDRCFGLPYIPGSAVKGVTRSAALWDIRNTSDFDKRGKKLRLALYAFGFTADDVRDGPRGTGDFLWAADNKSVLREALAPFVSLNAFQGVISFLPAQPTEQPEIIAEVITSHPRADQAAKGRGRVNPIFFPAVKEGSSFGFAIVTTCSQDRAPIELVLKQAATWLQTAVTEQGIGAKTALGYGWFSDDPRAGELCRNEMNRIAQAHERDEADKAAIAAIKAAPAIIQQLKQLSVDELRVILNKFQFPDSQFWPTTGEAADRTYQLSLLELLLNDDTLRSEMTSKTKGAKSVKYLAAKFGRTLP